MQDLTNEILNLMSRVKANIRMIDNNKHLNVYLINEFFQITNKYWKEIRLPNIASYFLELQHIILNDILLEIIVNKEKGNLYNSTMTYNATCTEEDIHYLFNIPYGGNGEIEHLNIHTGYGNGVSDLKSEDLITLKVSNEFGDINYVQVGPNFEVKDYKNKDSAKYYFEKQAETSVYHDSNHVFIHILDNDTYYIAANKKGSKWYKLVDTENIKHFRKQVILWICQDGFLGVKFREPNSEREVF